MTLEEKVRQIVADNVLSISVEDDPGGKIAFQVVDDTVNDLMTMLRKGAYV